MKPNFDSPEKKYPSMQDLQDLHIQVSGLLGRGDLIHEVSALVTRLYYVFDSVNKSGWTDNLLKEWNEKSTRARELIIKVKLDYAKEKGLL